jgi:hypothetical protein
MGTEPETSSQLKNCQNTSSLALIVMAKLIFAKINEQADLKNQSLF